MSSSQRTRTPSHLAVKPVRVLIACTRCRDRKVKCVISDVDSTCQRCSKYGLACEFKSVAEHTAEAGSHGASHSPSSATFGDLRVPQVGGLITPNSGSFGTGHSRPDAPGNLQIPTSRPVQPIPELNTPLSTHQSIPSIRRHSAGDRFRSYPSQPYSEEYTRAPAPGLPSPLYRPVQLATPPTTPFSAGFPSSSTSGYPQTGANHAAWHPFQEDTRHQMHPRGYQTAHPNYTTPMQPSYPSSSYVPQMCYCTGPQCYCGLRRS